MLGGNIDLQRLHIFDLKTRTTVLEFVFNDQRQAAKSRNMRYGDYLNLRIAEILKHFQINPDWIDIIC